MDRGSDSGLMTTVWQFVMLPDVLQILKDCDDKPLCHMLNKIAKDTSKAFTKTDELLRLLGYSTSDAAAISHSHYALPNMARLLLKLSGESEAIRERFKAHVECTRFCGVSDLLSTQASEGHINFFERFKEREPHHSLHCRTAAGIRLLH